MTRDYKPVVTHVSNKIAEDVASDISVPEDRAPDEFESPKSKNGWYHLNIGHSCVFQVLPFKKVYHNKSNIVIYGKGSGIHIRHYFSYF